MLRTFILIIVSLVAAFWLWIVAIAFLTNLGPQENGFTVALAIMASAPFLAFTLPALFLALKRRLLWLALVLALLSLVSLVLGT